MSMSIVRRVSENVPCLTCYNLDIHSSIMIIFGTRITEEAGNQDLLYFPPHITYASALPGETGNPKLCLFT